jgi:hypothetical protein
MAEGVGEDSYRARVLGILVGQSNERFQALHSLLLRQANGFRERCGDL